MKGGNYYSNHDQMYVAVDCIIIGFDGNGLQILLIKRGFEPEAGKWSLMGGFVDQDKSIDEEAKRVLHSLTGLSDIFMKQLYVFGNTKRDPVARTISVAYYALINIHNHNEKLFKDHGARWFPINKIPSLIFDHKEMIGKAIWALKEDARTRPIGFELLPEKFTLPQLKRLYDCILQQEHDVRNFTKKILATGVLKNLEEKDFSSSKKGAYLYRFDKNRYKALQKEGLTFVF
jgi:8-oxo-dGTP diphosphatase